MGVNSARLRIIWRGLRIYLPLALLLYLLYQNKTRQRKMNTTNKIGMDVYFLLIENGFGLQMSRLLTAQAAHETANFSSSIFKSNNNLFGMKRPAIRPTTATGENKGHATYDSIEDSIQDISLYLKSRSYLTNYSTVGAYVRALKEKSYFEDSLSHYEAGVAHFYNLYFYGK